MRRAQESVLQGKMTGVLFFSGNRVALHPYKQQIAFKHGKRPSPLSIFWTQDYRNSRVWQVKEKYISPAVLLSE